MDHSVIQPWNNLGLIYSIFQQQVNDVQENSSINLLIRKLSLDSIFILSLWSNQYNDGKVIPKYNYSITCINNSLWVLILIFITDNEVSENKIVGNLQASELFTVQFQTWK